MRNEQIRQRQRFLRTDRFALFRYSLNNALEIPFPVCTYIRGYPGDRFTVRIENQGHIEIVVNLLHLMQFLRKHRPILRLNQRPDPFIGRRPLTAPLHLVLAARHLGAGHLDRTLQVEQLTFFFLRIHNDRR